MTMTKCYKCKVSVKHAKSIKEGIELNCMKCPKCGEEYFTSSELMRFDILTGRRKNIRKFGTLGDSTIMRIPAHIISSYKIKPGDYASFEERPEGILIKPISASKL